VLVVRQQKDVITGLINCIGSTDKTHTRLPVPALQDTLTCVPQQRLRQEKHLLLYCVWLSK